MNKETIAAIINALPGFTKVLSEPQRLLNVLTPTIMVRFVIDFLGDEEVSNSTKQLFIKVAELVNIKINEETAGKNQSNVPEDEASKEMGKILAKAKETLPPLSEEEEVTLTDVALSIMKAFGGALATMIPILAGAVVGTTAGSVAPGGGNVVGGTIGTTTGTVVALILMISYMLGDTIEETYQTTTKWLIARYKEIINFLIKFLSKQESVAENADVAKDAKVYRRAIKMLQSKMEQKDPALSQAQVALSTGREM